MNYKEKEYFESHKTGTLYLNEQLEKIQWFACVETDAYDEVIYNPQDYKKENLEELMEYIKAHAVQYRLPEKKGKEGQGQDHWLIYLFQRSDEWKSNTLWISI